MRITPTTLTINQLLSSSSEQYFVPAYQRRYSWHKKHLQDLLDDIDILDDSDTHLLGNIVCLSAPHTAGVNRLELVDGQQRLTTVCILLQCIHDRLLDLGETDAARDVAPLLTAKALGAAPVRKVALDSLDAKLFDRLLRREHENDTAENPALGEAFAKYREWATALSEPEIRKFLYRLTERVQVVRLDVGLAKDAFKLFETINNRGLRLSHLDIVKNFLLGNAARFGQDDLEFARERWAALVAALDGVSAETFLRQFVSSQLCRRITKAFVVANFKGLFMEGVEEARNLPEHQRYVEEELDEEEDEEEDDDGNGTGDTNGQVQIPAGAARVPFGTFLQDLVRSARLYGEIVRAKTGKARIDRRLQNLRRIKAVQTYGFLTHLRAKGCSDNEFEEVLKLTEAFLMRRHVCRMRANETETAFARLCKADPGDPLGEVRKTYGEFSPSDDRFREDFAAAKFDRRLVERARYCLEQFEAHLQGTHSELLVAGPDSVHVEHIIPQKITSKRAKEEYGDWPTYLGRGADLHATYVSRIGNLTLLAEELNIKASNNPYRSKRAEYQKTSLKITQELCRDYPEFRIKQVQARSETLAERAVRLWPIP